MIETIHCLYCDTENTIVQGDNSKSAEVHSCNQCGMALPQCHPHSGTYRRKKLVVAFVIITVFCFVMMYYLPR